jgi:hypothetical protein
MRAISRSGPIRNRGDDVMHRAQRRAHGKPAPDVKARREQLHSPSTGCEPEPHRWWFGMNGYRPPSPDGIPTECTVCGVKLLNPHEITGLCRECKLILRNERINTANTPGRNPR